MLDAPLPLADAEARSEGVESSQSDLLSGSVSFDAIERVGAMPYPGVAAMPTQEGPDGLRYDFNLGARVFMPRRETGMWRVRLFDVDTGNILFDARATGDEAAQAQLPGTVARSTKSYFLRARIEVWDLADGAAPTLVLQHTYDATDQEVLIHFPAGTLGDTLAWLPYAIRFWQVSGCRLTIALGAPLIPLLRASYPAIRFLTHDQATAEKLEQRAYATYRMGLFFDDADCRFQPTDFRHVGLHRTAGYILGVDPAEEPLRLKLPDESRPIAEPYVCIATQATTQNKYWNNPFGWREVIAFLVARGYRVICIDQLPVNGKGLVWNHIPYGAEDQTGDKPLAERARWLRHASAFIGLSSGLSWLAWSVGAPVVMISGFTHPTNEFFTPYRIINWHACNSCWNDVRYRFQHDDFLWCPRHAGTPRQFECTRLITAEQVINVLKRVDTLPEIMQ